jgi:hypothetical protein
MCGEVDPEFLAAWTDARFGCAIRSPLLVDALRRIRGFSYAVKTNRMGMAVLKVSTVDGRVQHLTRSEVAQMVERRRKLRGEPKQKLITDFIGKTSFQKQEISV